MERKSISVQSVFDPQTYDAIRERAKQEGRSLSQTILIAVREYIRRFERKHDAEERR